MHPGARFSDPAELYDLIYGFKDYASEAARVRQILHDNGIADGSRVMEGACGTGAYLGPLSEHFVVSGYDLDPGMVAVARRRAPRATLWVGDLLDATPDEPVDAAIVLFGGLAYVHPEPQLATACRTLFASLLPGGVALVEPWLTPQDHTEHTVQMAVVDLPYLKVARQCVPVRQGDLLTLDFHYLVARPGMAVEHITESNALYLYTLDAWMRCLRGAGFEVALTDQGFMPEKRLFVCRRPGDLRSLQERDDL